MTVSPGQIMATASRFLLDLKHIRGWMTAATKLKPYFLHNGDFENFDNKFAADKLLKLYLLDIYAGACVQVAAVWQEWSVSWASAAWAACWDHLGYLLTCCLAPVTPLKKVQQVVWRKNSMCLQPLASCLWWRGPIWSLVPWKKVFTYPVQCHYSRSKSLQHEQCNSGQLTQCTVEVPRQHDEHVYIL